MRGGPPGASSRPLSRPAVLIPSALLLLPPPTRDDFNIAVLQAFLELHEFTDLNLVQALRQFLWSFRLPGEAQKIDRMMEAFARRYCRCNPGVFQSAGGCGRGFSSEATPTLTSALPCRHLLRVVLRRDHAEHQPAQPKREGQAVGAALHRHEQGHQRGRRPAGGAAQGEEKLLPTGAGSCLVLMPVCEF